MNGQESIDMDDLDDEDMAKMDEALSNIFKSICKKKSAGTKKKEMKDKLAIMHFKIRALDMVSQAFTRQYLFSPVETKCPFVIPSAPGALTR